ncbi:MAG: hypothetical protein ABIT05_13430 [Chitinophagaceae bacterium]
MESTIEIKKDFQALIENAYRVSQDTGFIVEEALRNAVDHPLPKEEVEKLLSDVIEKLKSGALKRGDNETAEILKARMNGIIQQAIQVREKVLLNSFPTDPKKKKVSLASFNKKEPGQVHPRPTFHRREVAMNCGGVKTTDITLWENNERLDIHMGQFKATQGRKPFPSEILDIMLSKMSLAGLSGKDQFKIEKLALSIANNGVRKPPIIDFDGTLLDGNRRVAACHYILNSDDFDSVQKKRAENIFVWQLTEHATEEDREAVVVSLNFEDDNKEEWTHYVKAHIIYREWQAMHAREPRSPSAARSTLMKKDLASDFGYSEKEWPKVDRYIRMVTWANDFEDYLVNEKQYDAFKVKHQASEHFEYFDELSKGVGPGTVAFILNQNETFKHLVFELLFQDKFVNFKLIRYLKFYNDEVVEELGKARDTQDLETAQDMVTRKLEASNAEQPETRSGNPNHRIEVFSKWLEKVPIADFRDKIKIENLKKLLGALRLVERQVRDLELESEN